MARVPGVAISNDTLPGVNYVGRRVALIVAGQHTESEPRKTKAMTGDESGAAVPSVDVNDWKIRYWPFPS